MGVTLAKAETTIDLRRVFPVITADGIGESTARWVFVPDRLTPWWAARSFMLSFRCLREWKRPGLASSLTRR